MNSIHDITDYIILRVKSEDRFASLINLKLQKLLYYVQAWSYGINKKPMFDGEFEAWIHGPVNREIYNRFNSTKYLYSEINIDDCMNHNVSLSSEDAEFIDFILENDIPLAYYIGDCMVYDLATSSYKEDNDLYNWFADIVVKRQHIRGEK